MSTKKLVSFFACVAFALVLGLVVGTNNAYASEGVDINNLRDGEYEVGIRMVKDPDFSSDSMANGAIEHVAKLTVKDGKSSMKMTFGYLNLYGMQGHLGWIKSNNSAEGGVYEDSKVLSYFLDENGDPLKDDFNSGDVADNMKIDYVKDVEFNIPDYVFEQDDHLLRCQVFVPVMESIMAGAGTQKVFVKVCFEGLKMSCMEYGQMVDLDIPAITPTAETVEAWNKYDKDLQANKDAINELLDDNLSVEELKLVKPIVDKAVEDAKDLEKIEDVKAVLESAKKQIAEVKTIKTISNSEKSVSLTSLLPINCELNTTQLDNADYKDVVGSDYEVVKALNITLNHKLTKNANVEILVDESLNNKMVKVLHLNSDNTVKETFEVKVVDGRIVLEVDSLSPFIIATKVEKPVEPQVPVVPGSENLEFGSLKDGQYTISGEMIKTNMTDKSMSNNAIDHNILLTVEDGKYYVTITFKGLKVGQKLGYLGNLKFYDDNGQLQNAQVISSVTYDGKTYPEKVKVELNSEAMKSGWQKLQVFVQTMEDIAKGCGTQDVYLKLDLNSVKAGAPEKSNFTQPKHALGTPKTGDMVSVVSMSTAAVAGVAALAASRKYKQD